ncbi:hypothetical protein TNCT6_71270 [Streptomyces sp. 6-11-2]|nr:hypothetical protein TNCT6_71270 [Streptomyces sp. 6-11-2]
MSRSRASPTDIGRQATRASRSHACAYPTSTTIAAPLFPLAYVLGCNVTAACDIAPTGSGPGPQTVSPKAGRTAAVGLPTPTAREASGQHRHAEPAPGQTAAPASAAAGTEEGVGVG